MRKPFKYCPYCGEASLENHQPFGDDRPRLICTECDEIFYENPKPVVSAVIESDGKVLLAKRAQGQQVGRWDLPGGFVEMDETAEEAVLREVFEEVGCRISLHGVLGVFRETGGGYGPSINIHFRAKPLCEPHATKEVSEVGWFGRDELPPPKDFAFENDFSALELWKNLPPLEKPKA